MILNAPLALGWWERTKKSNSPFLQKRSVSSLSYPYRKSHPPKLKSTSHVSTSSYSSFETPCPVVWIQKMIPKTPHPLKEGKWANSTLSVSSNSMTKQRPTPTYPSKTSKTSFRNWTTSEPQWESEPYSFPIYLIIISFFPIPFISFCIPFSDTN